jgi:hypothetical protein
LNNTQAFKKQQSARKEESQISCGRGSNITVVCSSRVCVYTLATKYGMLTVHIIVALSCRCSAVRYNGATDLVQNENWATRRHTGLLLK